MKNCRAKKGTKSNKFANIHELLGPDAFLKDEKLVQNKNI